MSEKEINSIIDLTGVEPGAWNVVVENPDPAPTSSPTASTWASSPIAAWGSDAYGQIISTPTDPDFVAMDGGYYHIMGLHSDGSITAWGQDDFGQVSDTPTDSDFVAVAAGALTTWASTPTAPSRPGEPTTTAR